ncbi:IS4 family transposase [Streptomyces sp. NBC_01474]|uniref:IS4 family transposase n=1 Tax=Streptomyces sp. NBC_01474 TaxID=2903880 RepID=UPI002DD94698|nr:IS4 family transposase [Streptomyces sp. NBC_01474]WSD94767.1 IS4 family transposase [Streptomyces sp. NBC_01474]
MGGVRDGSAAVSGVRLTDRVGVGVLTRLVDRDLVDEVLAETRRTEKRSRLLPARVVVYYVLALCLFFGESYEEVMRLLVNGLRFLGTWRKDWTVPTTGAISQARRRLGPEPLRVLFERVAVPCAQRGTQGAWLGRWRLMAIDGFVLDIPDTPANDAEFGRSGGKANPAPFPQVKIVGLGECGTHAVVAARLGPWRVDEGVLAGQLVSEFEPGMLVTADRGFYAYRLWEAAARACASSRVRPTGVRMPRVGVDDRADTESVIIQVSKPSDQEGSRVRCLIFPDPCRVGQVGSAQPGRRG